MIPALRRTLVISATLLAAASIAFAFDSATLESKVTEHHLKNGLTILVMERPEAPVISFATWVDAGSVDDPKGYTGLAHMFEHMAFKGTTTLGTKNYSQEKKLIAVEDSLFMLLRAERNKGRLADSARVAELQGQYEQAREASYQVVNPNEFMNIVDIEGGNGLNAGTFNDQTVYFLSLPSNKLELWMAMESERFLNPVLREMYKERDVIAEERRMRYESNPIGKLIEEYEGVAFKAHPYGIAGIGYMSDIEYYSRKEAEAFFKKYYVPSNVIISIVGDVKAPDVIKMAEKYWGRIPYSPKPERIATIEPPMKGERRVVLNDPSQPIYLVGWHTPELVHPDREAIDAALQYLASGRTSQLYKSMVKEKQMAVDVGSQSGFPGDKYPSTSFIYAVPAASKTNAECEAEIFAAVEKLRTELIPQAELDKIKARAKVSVINQFESNDGLAFLLAQHHARYGTWKELFKVLDRINAVTVEDVQRVAKQYLHPDNRIVAMIETAKS